MLTRVELSSTAIKQLSKVPSRIQGALALWVHLVETHGVFEVRKIPGYHDEPIAFGVHSGRRSIRLNRAYRAFYVIHRDGAAELVLVEEVNKHKYDR